MAVVITDAPCHGKDYHSCDEDSFVDSGTGLSCAGKPEDALNALKAKHVEVMVLHTNQNVSKMLAKFQQVMPRLRDGHVAPAKTSEYVINMLKDRLMLQPLSYLLCTFALDGHEDCAVPASGHTVQIKTTDNEVMSYSTGSDGLVWVGQNEKENHGKHKAMIQRPLDSTLDAQWATESDWSPVCSVFEEGGAMSSTMAVLGK
jgi:hypothetical protein